MFLHDMASLEAKGYRYGEKAGLEKGKLTEDEVYEWIIKNR